MINKIYGTMCVCMCMCACVRAKMLFSFSCRREVEIGHANDRLTISINGQSMALLNGYQRIAGYDREEEEEAHEHFVSHARLFVY